MASPDRGLSANLPPCRREGAGNETQPCLLHTENEAKRKEIRAKQSREQKRSFPLPWVDLDSGVQKSQLEHQQQFPLCLIHAED